MTGVIGAIWGLTGRQWLQTLLLPPRLVLPFQRNNCGARLFEILRQKKKMSPAFQVSGPVSLAIWKLLSPKWPIKSLLIQRVSSSATGALRLLGNGALLGDLLLLFVGELQRPEFFSLMCLGAGSQASNQQSDETRMCDAGCKGGRRQ